MGLRWLHHVLDWADSAAPVAVVGSWHGGTRSCLDSDDAQSVDAHLAAIVEGSPEEIVERVALAGLELIRSGSSHRRTPG
jgi:hypothetical protein